MFLASSESIHSFKWISYFEKIGYEICWVSLHPKRPVRPFSARFEYINPPRNILSWIKAARELRAVIKDFKPDVLHTHSAGTYGLLSLLTGFNNKIITVWGSDILLNSKKPLLSLVTKKILNAHSLITTDAHHMMHEMSKFGISNAKIEIINFGVDVEKFRPKFANTETVQKKYSLHGSHRIISTRNFEKIYDVATLIRASKIVLKKFPEAQFYLGGRGAEKDALESIINKMGLEKSVHFLGFINNDELPDLLSQMDLYVSTSLSDAGIAASTAEAMSCGVIPVITDVFDNSEWVIEGENGYLFNRGSAENLALKILQVLSLDLTSLKKMKQSARQKIMHKNNYEVEMKKMQKLLSSHIC